MAFWSSLGFQNLAGSTCSQLETLHDGVMVWLVVIMAVVSLLSAKVYLSLKGMMSLDSELLEKTWTLVPMLILLTIAFPSLHLLCLQDSMLQIPSSTLKVISNQWNWQSETEEPNDHLLDVDSVDNLGAYEVPVVLGSSGISRVLLTSTDVLHSLGLPGLGIKLDSVPGRVNATMVEAFMPGLFVGSCYELCGSGHSAMPINLLLV